MSKTDRDDERAARAAAEVKQTEELLAGFDRPGRTPRAPAVTRDFVDYHQKKERSGPGEAAARVMPRDPKRAEPTFVVRRGGKRLPQWTLWLALLVGMPAAGMLVAYVALGRDAPAPPATSGARAPSASTTISAASSPVSQTNSVAPDEPPAPPPNPGAGIAPSQSSSARPSSSSSSSSASSSAAVRSRPSSRASSSPSGASNPDFIKDL